MTTTKKINLSIGIFIIFIIFFIVFLIYPFSRDIKNNSEELIFQKENLDNLQFKIENLENFKNSYKEFKPNLEKIEDLFVDSKMPVDFINFLEKNAADCQAIIKISPASSRKIEKDFWPSIAFQINIISSFPNFLKFLQKLETGPYLAEVQNLNVNRLSGENYPVGDVNVNLFFKVFIK